jgi:hypothetical protein
MCFAGGGNIAVETVGHLDRDPQVLTSFVEQFLQILTGVLIGNSFSPATNLFDRSATISSS